MGGLYQRGERGAKKQFGFVGLITRTKKHDRRNKRYGGGVRVKSGEKWGGCQNAGGEQ